MLDAATRLLAANPGASTQAIAEAAAISRASLHRLFPSRVALVDEIAAVAVERVAGAIAASRVDEGPALEAITRLTESVVGVVDGFAFLTTEMELQGWRRFRAEDRRVEDILTRLFTRGQEAGALRADLPAAWLVRSYAWLLYAVAVAQQRGDIARREAARLVLSSFLRGAAAPGAAVW